MNLLNIILANAKMSWDDIDVVWCKDLAVTDAAHPDQGDSPAARMRRGECDVCFVISPERNGLTGGVKSVGNGKEGTVKGAKQILSTATLSRGVADVVYVRKDFYDAYPDYCKKLTAGYIRGTYDLMEGQTDWLAGKKTTEPAKSYIAAITYAKKYFGEAAIPEVTVDGVGMVQDAEFMGIPGNISFFQDSGNLNNFERMQTEVLNLANTLKVTKVRSGFLPAPWDWKEIASLAGVKYTEPNKTKGRIAESVDLLPGDEAISEFTVNFQPDQDTFNVDTYGDVLDHTIKMAASYRSGVVLVRGHTDVSKTLFDLVVALKSTGAITESGNGTAKQYFLNGEPLDLTQTPAIMKLIAETQFDGFPRSVTLPGKGPRMIDKPSDDVAAMDALSRKRAEAFKAAVIARATAQKVNLDASQIQITGVGVREPLVKRPKNADEAKKNMRVEIQVREVGSEALSSELFEP